MDAGQVLIQGREAKVSAPRKAVENRMGLVPEDRGSSGSFQKPVGTAEHFHGEAEAAVGLIIGRSGGKQKDM